MITLGILFYYNIARRNYQTKDFYHRSRGIPVISTFHSCFLGQTRFEVLDNNSVFKGGRSVVKTCPGGSR